VATLHRQLSPRIKACIQPKLI